MRAERKVERRGGVLDRVMIISVGLAVVLAFAVWFFGFAGSSLPGRAEVSAARSPPAALTAAGWGG